MTNLLDRIMANVNLNGTTVTFDQSVDGKSLMISVMGDNCSFDGEFPYPLNEKFITEWLSLAELAHHSYTENYKRLEEEVENGETKRFD